MALSAPLSFANAQTELATITSQTANFTFTSDELTSALTQAWMDGFVVSEAYDSSLTYTAGTYIYAIPATMRTVEEIYIILPEGYQNNPPLVNTAIPGPISSDLYEIINGSIYFRDITSLYFDDSYTLYLKGQKKLQTTDNLPTENLCLYVLWLAADNLMQMLLLKSAFVFLRNDTNLQAIVAASKITSTKVLEMKQRLQRHFESV
jgi:hypothetical protein